MVCIDRLIVLAANARNFDQVRKMPTSSLLMKRCHPELQDSESTSPKQSRSNSNNEDLR
jgi:hypothetical protein